jgi:hypothetical protein
MKVIRELIHWIKLVEGMIFFIVHIQKLKSDDILAKKAAEITIDPDEPEYVSTDAKLVNAIMAEKSYIGLGVSKNVKVHSQK